MKVPRLVGRRSDFSLLPLRPTVQVSHSVRAWTAAVSVVVALTPQPTQRCGPFANAFQNCEDKILFCGAPAGFFFWCVCVCLATQPALQPARPFSHPLTLLRWGRPARTARRTKTAHAFSFTNHKITDIYHTIPYHTIRLRAQCTGYCPRPARTKRPGSVKPGTTCPSSAGLSCACLSTCFELVSTPFSHAPRQKGRGVGWGLGRAAFLFSVCN